MNDDDHPLFRHFHALSAALDDQLAQSHHHARAASRAQSQSHLLSRQLAILNHELTALRAQASSLPPSTESSLKINQLSLALRALNEKLELTERLLLERTRRLDHASSDASAARSAMDSAYDLAARIRTREQELLDHQADLQTKLRLEQAKSSLNERVIQDYADLVRKLEGRQSSNPKDEQPTALERLGEDFRSSTTHLQHQLSSSQHDLSILQTQLDAQTEINKDLISRLSQLQVEMDKRERDDNTASKMVSRYMKFSQQSTNALQTTLTSLQSRHNSTLTSYTSQIHLLQNHISTLTTSDTSHQHLQSQLFKESFCRRQETKFRLRLLSREEKIVQDLKRWLRKNEERLGLLANQEEDDISGSKGYFTEMIQDAKIIIDDLDNPIQIEFNDAVQPVSGSLARFVVVQSTVHDLLGRLHYEQGRRMELEEMVGRRDGFVGTPESEVEMEDGKDSVDYLKESTEVGTDRTDERISSNTQSTNDNESIIPIPEVGSESEVSQEDRKDSVELREPTEVITERIDEHISSYTQSTNDNESIIPIPEVGSESEVSQEDRKDSVELKEPTEVITERTDEHISSYTPITDENESIMPIPEARMEDRKGSVDLQESTEVSIEQTDERIFSYTQSTNDNESKTSLMEVGNESDVHLEDRMDSLDLREPSELVTELTDERIFSCTQNTDDQPEEPTTHILTPTSGDVVPGHGERNEKIDILVEHVDTVKDEENAVVDDDDGSITQAEEQTGNPPLIADLAPLNPPPPSSSASNQTPPHPLLTSLQHSQNRYTHIQNGFHDCHIALENLKRHLLVDDNNDKSALSNTHDGIDKKKNIPYDSLRIIVQRLDDYTEDVRVELEIRILDEEVLRRGYETLLSMSSSRGEGEEWTEEDIVAFVNGTDPIIARAMKSFKGKLRDLEEDVVMVKKAVYAFDDVVNNVNNEDDDDGDDNDKQEKLMLSNLVSSSSLSTETLVASPTPGWISSWISPSRSTTPVPIPHSSSSTSNLTFGDIMTSRSRKISSSSLATPSPSPLSKSKSRLNSGSILRRTVSSFGLSSSQSDKSFGMHERMTTGDVIRVLQLKTAMPELLVHGSSSLGGREDEEQQEEHDYFHTSGSMSQFSNNLGSITTPTRSSSFALGMGMGMGMGRIGSGGGGGAGAGNRGRGMLGVPVSVDERRMRRVVSANAATSGMTGTRIVNVTKHEKEPKEDID